MFSAERVYIYTGLITACYSLLLSSFPFTVLWAVVVSFHCGLVTSSWCLVRWLIARLVAWSLGLVSSPFTVGLLLFRVVVVVLGPLVDCSIGRLAWWIRTRSVQVWNKSCFIKQSNALSCVLPGDNAEVSRWVSLMLALFSQKYSLQPFFCKNTGVLLNFGAWG